jgi:amino acid adenylation domain-containing protein
VEKDDGLLLGFDYAKDLFKAETIERLARHFVCLLEEIVLEPNKDIRGYNILSTEERQQITVDWNRTEAEYPRDKTIQQLFEEQVERTPDSVAVVFGDKQLSYKELNGRANQFAHYLRDLGVTKETLVAISLERSFELIISLLGILKSGGAYVPLDPDYPEDRLNFMLEDTGAPVLITSSTLSEKFPYYQGIIIETDKDQEKISREPLDNPTSINLARDLAYVIYTSGSTGKPKGVMIEHESVNNLLFAMEVFGGVKEGELFIQNTSLSFDPSVWTIFWPLSGGGTVLLPEAEEDKNPAIMINMIKKDRIRILHSGPSLLRALMGEENFKDCNSLKKIIGGGEEWSIDVLERLKMKLPESELCNVYGPTEATIHVSVWRSEGLKGKINKIPIGRPIWNTSIYILDQYLNPVPVGVSGELYIGGIGLARGYLGQPGLTAERFIQNPFATSADVLRGVNLRLYRTGDLARYLPDGNIEYLGRIDEQVKIRGFRIELGEIENVLSSCKDVKAAIVVAREEEGNKRLVGYVVASEEARKDLILQSTFKSSSGEMIDILGGEGLGTIIENIRNDLTRQLPDYMVPSFFVLIGKIPLTANGKVDKKILPSPDINLTISTKYVGPRNEIERKLCEIWSEVLRIEKIGIYDNFFEIGGHSLLATQVISRIRKDLEVELPLKTLFSAPTIAGISEGVEKLKGTAVLIPAITAEIRPKRIPLSFAQQRLWFLDQLLPNQSLYNIPMALRLKGQLDIDALEKALDYIIQRHEILRTHIESEEGEAYQVINLDFRFILERVDLRSVVGKARNEEASRLIRAEASRLFELGKGPLIRGKILILGSEENIFILNMHHIISDGWSFDIFLKELREAYNAYRKGDSPVDLPLMIQYADFAIWQRNWLQGEVLEKQLEYWQKELDGIPEMIALPTDYARPQELSYSGGVHVYHISKELLAKIKGISESQGTTLFMTLLGAFQVLLYKYTGQEDIVIGSPIANRHYKEIEELIGFFINTLALRGKLRGELTFCEVLSQVKETTLNAYAHQDVPFEQLVDYLNVSRSLNHNPVFQVMFILQNAVKQEE